MFCVQVGGIDLRDGFESVDWLDAVALVGQAMRRDAEEATAVSEVVLGDREIRELASL